VALGEKSLDGRAVARRRLQVHAPERHGALLHDVRPRTRRHFWDWDSLVIELGGSEVAHPAVEPRAAGVDPREDAFDAAEARRRESRPRHDALHAELESIAAGYAANLNDAANQIAIRDAHRVAQNVHRLHCLERQVERRDASGRIGDVEAVDEERRVGRARAADLQQPIGTAHD
jgi:hypothetical protein